MMDRIAFYAPLKSPEHPVPSGDRELAAGIRAALARNDLGLTVELVSALRTYDGQGDSTLQRELVAQAEQEISRVMKEAQSSPWRVWVTYHNYYKAPDLIGPIVSRRLGIPYILIEASIATRRRSGPWADYAARSDRACSQAAIILYLTERDREALVEHRQDRQIIAHLHPFLNRETLPEPAWLTTNGSSREILTVGMLRHADKLASYQIIAGLLPQLNTRSWRLSIVGDGPARDEVESLFRPFGDRVVFHGQLRGQALDELYRGSTVFLWPGVNEAFGMVYLEAQAAGLPVVAQDRPGVRDVVAPGNALLPVEDNALMAKQLDCILTSPELQRSMAENGRDWVRSNHLLDSAATALTEHLTSVLKQPIKQPIKRPIKRPNKQTLNPTRKR